MDFERLPLNRDYKGILSTILCMVKVKRANYNSRVVEKDSPGAAALHPLVSGLPPADMGRLWVSDVCLHPLHTVQPNTGLRSESLLCGDPSCCKDARKLIESKRGGHNCGRSRRSDPDQTSGTSTRKDAFLCERFARYVLCTGNCHCNFTSLACSTLLLGASQFAVEPLGMNSMFHFRHSKSITEESCFAHVLQRQSTGK